MFEINSAHQRLYCYISKITEICEMKWNHERTYMRSTKVKHWCCYAGSAIWLNKIKTLNSRNEQSFWTQAKLNQIIRSTKCWLQMNFAVASEKKNHAIFAWQKATKVTHAQVKLPSISHNGMAFNSNKQTSCNERKDDDLTKRCLRKRFQTEGWPNQQLFTINPLNINCIDEFYPSKVNS